MGVSVLYYTSVLLIVSGNVRYVASFEKINGPECGISSPVGRITFGKISTKKEVPWIVAVMARYRNGQRSFCGGSIISPSFVLTAAHCVHSRKLGETAPKIWVNYNSTRRSEGDEVLVRGLRIHPQYLFQDANGKGHDIAIMMLWTRLEFDDFVRPVCLPTKKMNFFTKEFVIAGWGASEEGRHTEVLRRATTKALAYEDCKPIINFEKTALNESIVICSFPLRKNLCVGDEGGPMTTKGKDERHVLLGISMSATSCADYESVSLYTRVSAFLPFIKDNMRILDRRPPNPC